MATSSRSNHELLQIINGKSALRSQEEICNALKLNQKRLLEMLDYYKKPSNDSANRLKNDNTIGKASKEFILKLSTFLGLDEWQSHQLLLSYLMFAFKGTRKQLQVIIGEERNSQALIIKIMEYYFSERMCLLHCIKHILSFWQDENHPYLVQYSESINDLMQDDQLNKNLISQLEKSFISMVPTSQKHGQLM
ncbi:nucleoporin NUP188-like, partial [Saccoglossus kowalevskii]|uniref:Nucleoporin NUP188 homolog n=1 Tax=Saccoglossus kowalevskii TaxID=10224 RepID=A0ABM0LZ56_SACKO